MEPTYYVASLKHNAWWSKANQWHSDMSEAKGMDYLSAIAFAKKQRSNRAVPVRISDMERVNA